MALLADVWIADMVLDADLRRLEAITLADLLTDALERVGHRALRTNLLRLGQIVRDLDPWKMLWDRLTPAGVLALIPSTFVVRWR
jgi:hypothetical protein